MSVMQAADSALLCEPQYWKGQSLLWKIRKRHWFERSSIWSAMWQMWNVSLSMKMANLTQANGKSDRLTSLCAPWYRKKWPFQILSYVPLLLYLYLRKKLKILLILFFALASFCQLPTLLVSGRPICVESLFSLSWVTKLFLEV